MNFSLNFKKKCYTTFIGAMSNHSVQQLYHKILKVYLNFIFFKKAKGIENRNFSGREII